MVRMTGTGLGLSKVGMALCHAAGAGRGFLGRLQLCPVLLEWLELPTRAAGFVPGCWGRQKFPGAAVVLHHTVGVGWDFLGKLPLCIMLLGKAGAS